MDNIIMSSVNNNQTTISAVTLSYNCFSLELFIYQVFSVLGYAVTRLHHDRHTLFPRARTARVRVRACARI